MKYLQSLTPMTTFILQTSRDCHEINDPSFKIQRTIVMTNPDLKRGFSPLVEILRVQIHFGTLCDKTSGVTDIIKLSNVTKMLTDRQTDIKFEVQLRAKQTTLLLNKQYENEFNLIKQNLS